jgi:hypothetical protein
MTKDLRIQHIYVCNLVSLTGLEVPITVVTDIAPCEPTFRRNVSECSR